MLTSCHRGSWGSVLTVLTAAAAVVVAVTGCRPAFQRFDADLVEKTRASLAVTNATGIPISFDDIDEDILYEEQEEPARSVVVAELLAFFPGIFVHGLGHMYAGDRETATRLRNMGGWGYLFMAVGGGILLGAQALDESSDKILPISLYATGGTAGAVGVGFFLAAWFQDMYDTPRAIRSRGAPWRYFQQEGRIFDD